MKILIASTISLLLGLLIGACIGGYIVLKHWRREMDEEVAWMAENRDRLEAVRDAGAIQSLDAGKTQETVRMLSRPITYYYYVDAGDAKTPPDRTARAMIEQLASSNRTVAAAMTNVKGSFQGN